MLNKSPFKKFTRQLQKILIYICIGVCTSNPGYAQQGKDLPEVIALAEEYSQEGIEILYDEKKNSALLFLGVRHNFDPENGQILGIERFFRKFKPTLILYEGGDVPTESTKEQAVRRYAEAGLLRFLAEQSKIKSKTFEPQMDDEVAAVLKKHTAVEAKLYYLLRMVPQWMAEEDKQAIDQKMASLLTKEKFERNFGKNFPPNTMPNNMAEFEQLCAARLPELKDWRKIDFTYFTPGLKGTFFHQVKITSSAFRNKAIENSMFNGLENGERVFIVAGASHLGGTFTNVMKRLTKMEQ